MNYKNETFIGTQKYMLSTLKKALNYVASTDNLK